MKLQFTINNLKALDLGVVNEAFQRFTQRIVEDCCDRPGEKKPRKILLQFAFVPVASPGQNDCDEVAVSCQLKSKIPDHCTRNIVMRPTTAGQLYWNPELPDEPDGKTLWEESDDASDGKSRGSGK